MEDQRGFTLTEVMVALSFFMVISAMGIALTSSGVPSIRSTTQANRLIGVLQVAREEAITRQRDVEVRIDLGSSAIATVRLDEDGETPLASLVFEGGVRLMQFDGFGDTALGYGDDSAADFGESESLTFSTDGSFLGEDNLPLNGTFYLGIANRPHAARAVTLTGTTARPRLWQRSENAWVTR